ncbi:helix-turn-helix transcriptional regulator [Paenibacillus sp. TAB 01]|uniref:helix-turn-helix transcriptional regulator n=1 Tax=Paenibacillus sp. TAB 01 TaxID=3368988 RepID=UPI0037511AF8
MLGVVEARRKELKLSQEKFANKIGVSRQYYNAVENFRCKPSVKLAKEIAGILQVNWTIFFDN